MSERLFVLGTEYSQYQVGEVISLSIEKGEPQVGDKVYFLSVKKTIGIIAKAKVLTISDRDGIQFLISGSRVPSEIIPEFVLQYQFPNEKWPIFGCYQQFEPILQGLSLDEIWESSIEQHLASQILSLFKINKSPNSWYQKYTDFVEWFQKNKYDLSDEDIIKLWADSDAISSIAPQRINRGQCIENMASLRDIVERIIQTPTKTTHHAVKKQWKADTTFPSILHVAINRIYAASDPNSFTSIVSEGKYFKRLYTTLAPLLGITDKYSNWVESNILLKQELNPRLNIDVIEANTLLWELADYLEKGNAENIKFIGTSYDSMEVRESVSHYGVRKMSVPLNQILYGPPGTGKTYHTIEAAVKAAEPEEYAKLGIDSKQAATEEQRVQLIEQYELLSTVGRIRFVTFHQSYGYEEFVEGLKANSEDGEISYDVEKGVFRQICDEAAKHTTEKAASKAHSFDLCWQVFSEQLAEKDSIEIAMSQTSFRVMDFNAKRIFFEKSNGKKDHTLSINTLKDIFEGSRDYTSGLGVYYNPLVRYLKGLVAIEQQPAIKRQNYVLVIDEINRGNISKIFGELITLIEPSKRKGAEEELELQLPLSRIDEKFSVPDNLHIIGTMNTADRSLAMMDTALRRRFDFVEMMPRADLFSDHCIEWHGQKIDLKSLLEALNKRIEVLYDREHTLGHAFLFPAYNAAKSGQHKLAFDELKAAFKNKIIPLLEEYFYEDWNKIRLVLGDSLKQDEALQFLKIKKEKYSDLFGEFHGLDLYEEDKITYQVKPFDYDKSIWNKAEAYIGIYSLNSVKD
ncbi:McrB family protein [Vibrio splendidus]|nr:AAA family ATPase [Vibrio splendidus]MCC4878645.1 AAA family ATPase [Vibrio splendidus]